MNKKNNRQFQDSAARMERAMLELMNDYPVPGRVIPLSLESFIPFLEFIRKHEDFYRVALKTRRDFPLKQGFDPLWEQVIKPLCIEAGITSEDEMLLYFVGFQAGFTMILRHWVEHGCKENAEKIAQIIRSIIPSVWKTP